MDREYSKQLMIRQINVALEFLKATDNTLDADRQRQDKRKVARKDMSTDQHDLVAEYTIPIYKTTS